MAIARTRETFKQKCLRNLGAPVIEINIDDDQVEDRVDEALRYYADYHFDGSEKVYVKHMLTAADFPTAVKTVDIADGGTLYSNTDTIVFTANDLVGSNAAATLVTDANGTITSITMTNNGVLYQVPPTATVTTSTGSGADLRPQLGGYLDIPENTISIVNLFDVGGAFNINNLFSVPYQFYLNDLHTLTSTSMVPYYMARTHINLIEEMLVGKQPLRFNRHKNRAYIDMNWQRLGVGNYLVLEGYEKIDPTQFPDVWNDRWLERYCTALIKRQWGGILTKFTQMPMAGGMMFNGDKIYDDAVAEIALLETEMINSYSLPVGDMIG